uniref:GLOBIN domain-containing protein n=1 Tax=Caenorhabditis tropicalis TaxID=1561998 RepID=A0A1I7SZ27_9PELO
MPVVNTANFVDRLRDITKRIDIRPSLQNVSKRWHNVYEALAVGSPQQVQEFYKYIKVYKQCPANDLLFMNMTVQLARASMFPTKGMFKQMFKFEKHMDGLILAEGFHGIYGSRGIEILCGHNDHLLRSYRRYKRHSETKRADREMKTARKNAKQMAALREVRAKSKGPLPEIPAYSFESLVPGEGPIPARTPKVLDTTPKMAPEVLSPEAQDVVVKELSEVKKYCEILKAQMEEAEKKREEDDVANKLNEVVEKLISTKNGGNDEETDDDEGVENDEEDDENVEDQLPEDPESKLPDFQACNITEKQKKAIMRILLGVTDDEVTEEKKTEEPSDDEEEIEKIEEKDVDAMEYEML